MNRLQQDRSSLSLAGQWAYALDPHDSGEEENWYERGLPVQEGVLELPGTLSSNRIGEQVEWDGEMNRESVRSLRQRHRYVGSAWYQLEAELPWDWSGKRLMLYLERVMFKSTLWINGQRVGEQDSLSTPHHYDITAFARAGAVHRITIRIDNRDIQKLGEYPSAYTDETQTIWNGIIGRLEIQALEPVYIQDIQLYPDPDCRQVTVTGAWTNTTGEEVQARLALAARLCEEGSPQQAETQSDPFVIPPFGSKPLRLVYDMGEDVRLWDEFSPHVYEMRLAARVTYAGELIESVQGHRFGMRSFRRRGSRLEINGRAVFLRGTLECCIFPLTGHPPMELDAWLRLFRIAKEYGLNHIRFHSWCPPEAAFDAADQLGVYVQAEGPVWMDTWNTPVGAHPEHYSYLPAEAKRIVAAYGNHPSFCLFSNGNELNGDFDLLHRIIEELKRTDGRRLYTLTTNWDRPLDPADDLFCSQTVDGAGVRGQYDLDQLISSTTLDFREAAAKRNVPVVAHEVGQYAVYPDVDEIHAYTGTLRPVNLEAIRADLERRGLLEDSRRFVYGSGMLALQLYRDEIEAALRTPGFGGFQLLDLHDFPGQSTATVGILNAFWESKGLITPERFRQFCGPTVLLLRMDKRIYTQEEAFEAKVEIAHFGPAVLPASDVGWRITDESGRILDEGVIRTEAIPLGSGVPLGRFSSDSLSKIERSTKLLVSVSLALPGNEIRNEWPIWVYAGRAEEAHTAGSVGAADDNTPVYAAESLDERAEAVLMAGGCVLFAAGDRLRHTLPGRFHPVFWSPVHFASVNPCGIFVRKEHPLFRSFPTEEYAEYQWKDLLDRSVSVCLDGIAAELKPIVQVIPNFYHNRLMSNLFECRVGNGRLLVCGIDLQQDLETRPATRQLRSSISAYMRSEAFQPVDSISMEELRRLLEAKPADEEGTTLAGKELAIGRKAASDSASDDEHAAGKGNDGIGHTLWLAADETAGHWWQVDLGEERSLTGTRVKFHQPGNFLYVIHVSSDGADWRVAVNQTGQISAEQVRIDLFKENARFVRIVYHHLPAGMRAGHYAFEVYGYS